MSRTKEIAFSRIVSARGRNGLVKMAGIEVSSASHRDYITLFPVSTRGVSDSAWLEIPKEHLQELIDELQTHLP